MSYILGLNVFHADSSACILRDGVLIAAVEEERFRRVKHWAGFPDHAIQYCLDEARIEISQLDYIAINRNSRANIGRKFLHLLSCGVTFELISHRISNRNLVANIPSHLRRLYAGEGFNGKIKNIEHHRCHMASAFYASPFQEAVVVSVDGFGDFASTAWGVGSGTKLKMKQRIYFPHSLGIFYQAMTQFLGFKNYGDEYKVMGLAPYGRPTFLPEMRNVLNLKPEGAFNLDLKYFMHHKIRTDFNFINGYPVFGQLFSQELEGLLGTARAAEEPLTQRHMDIAHSTQLMYEEAFFGLLNHLHQVHGLHDIALAGGCAMNSVANGKIRLRTPFKRIYVQAAAGDAGGAIGAAFSAWFDSASRPRRRPASHDHAYWGPAFDDSYIEKVLISSAPEIRAHSCVVEKAANTRDLVSRTAQAIANGMVVGWFQGRMEWGPRALGARSILCDPRRGDAKDLLNIKIKRRESFRPFAPSVLDHAVEEWFEQDDSVPFMMQVYEVKEAKRSYIPAVTHVDGSGRLQTVTRRVNPLFYDLISEFNEITNVPMLLNTSFNENEPIVCTPGQALDCFLRTKMDILVVGNWMLVRP